jgi:SAM-dependent methyltransferase
VRRLAAEWERFSARYEDQVLAVTRFAAKRRQILDAVKPARVLDLGCGPVTYLLAELTARPALNVAATDFSPPMVREASNQLPKGSCRFVVADTRSLPFDKGSFDTVISVNSILPQVRSDVDTMFSEVVRVLSPGGRLVAVLPAFETSLVARDHWHIPIRVDVAGRREFDTTGWQCFYTKQDVADLMRRHGFTHYRCTPLWFRSADEQATVQRLYHVSKSRLLANPLFEHLVVADR